MSSSREIEMHEMVIHSRRSPIRTITGVQIAATGSYLPDEVVRNEDLAALGFDADWIIQRTGIRERRKAPPEISTSDMAVAAAKRAMEQAGVTGADIDLVILGTFTPDLALPASACLIQDRLGITGPAFDLQAGCAGFIYSMITGMQFVATGASKMALIVGADTNTRAANPADKKTYPLFGDGAGAVLLSSEGAAEKSVTFTIGADGSGEQLLCKKMGGSRIPHSCEGLQDNLHYLQMNGRPVFKWAIRLIEDTTREVLDHANLTLDDIDMFFMHQANVRILDAAASNLGISKDRVPVNLDRFGNTSAASIPILLDESVRNDRIKTGDRIMLTGFGAGLAWGTVLLEW